MALDIVGYINTNSTADQATKVRFLDGIAGSWGYDPDLGEAKIDFVNRKLIEYIIKRVENQEYEEAKQSINVSKINL